MISTHVRHEDFVVLEFFTDRLAQALRVHFDLLNLWQLLVGGRSFPEEAVLGRWGRKACNSKTARPR